jgi:hypothetical protein
MCDLIFLSELTFACTGLISNLKVTSQGKSNPIFYLVVKEQNFEGISIRVFCVYSENPLPPQAPNTELSLFFRKLPRNATHKKAQPR